MSAGYFAFVRRDESRRYVATLPDFPGSRVEAERLSDLAEAVRVLMREHAAEGGWPASTRLEKLPRQLEDHDGYWLMVEVGPPV
ncbi:hypothetical protein [Cognatilysobacter lacus]|uniref:Type II toxin-antitoxin system HicB family antitoxin n=1 Tax=Cognatilysobacter lacus TaxID=1643323 RepID=A0A5D8Z6S0_9GAMM|nr:hypothetical protein [Lysobacter lacus]TZF90370.1 hypothetical protein FW784_05550 [Lysobacter lacus]